MLSNKEKMLVTLSYYQGACDNVKMHTDVEKHDMLQDAVIKSTSKILEELGINMPNPFENKDLYDYMQEMEEITGILCKEDEYR